MPLPGKHSRQELLGLIEDYRQGLWSLTVPLTLIKHHLNRHPVPEWVHQQVYLNLYPKELMLPKVIPRRTVGSEQGLGRAA